MFQVSFVCHNIISIYQCNKKKNPSADKVAPFIYNLSLANTVHLIIDFIILLKIERYFVTFPVRFQLTLKEKIYDPDWKLFGIVDLNFLRFSDKPVCYHHHHICPYTFFSVLFPPLGLVFSSRRHFFFKKSHLSSIIAVTFSAIFSLSSHTQFTLFTCDFFRWKITSVCTTPPMMVMFFFESFFLLLLG